MSFLSFDLLLSQSLFDLFSASLSNNFYYLLCDYCIRCVTIPGSLLFFSKPIFSSFYHRFDNFACQICIFHRDNKFFIFFFCLSISDCCRDKEKQSRIYDTNTDDADMDVDVAATNLQRIGN